ncbi:hypothetical protein DRJ48_04110 [Candidatus Woesearchaeota archaeon]|nr:MAG: hypothetical protein DRJ48_04110 [Candidatus Woesearchaeota archaeon]
MKKAQSSIEAALVITFMIFVMITFMGVMVKRMSETEYRQQVLAIERVAGMIKREVELASRVEGGYSRNFTLPLTAGGLRYNVTLINSSSLGANYSELVVEALETRQRVSAVEILPKNVSGEFCVGIDLFNHIQKVGGIIRVECGSK